MVISDIKVRVCVSCSNYDVATHYEADVKQAVDAYPFGWEMPGRSFLGNDEYRYSTNGLEKSPEIASGHNSSYFRELDSRTGRWWATDPVTHPHQSPYSTFDNNPVVLSDPSGAVAGGDGGPGDEDCYVCNEDPTDPPEMNVPKKHFWNKKNFFATANEDNMTSILIDQRYQTNTGVKPLYEVAYEKTIKAGRVEMEFEFANGQTWKINTETGKFIPISGSGIINLDRGEMAALKNFQNNIKAGKGGLEAFQNMAKGMSAPGAYTGMFIGDFEKAVMLLAEEHSVSKVDVYKVFAKWLPQELPNPALKKAAESKFPGKNLNWVKVGGRVILLVGIGADILEVYYSENKSYTIAKKTVGWAAGITAASWAMTATGVAGQLGPQALAPEEIITVPLAGAIGFMAGYLWGETIYEEVTEYIFTRVNE